MSEADDTEKRPFPSDRLQRVLDELASKDSEPGETTPEQGEQQN